MLDYIGHPSGWDLQPGGLQLQKNLCGGAALGRFRDVSGGLCQLGHYCCSKRGARTAPKQECLQGFGVSAPGGSASAVNCSPGMHSHDRI
jgi:hypothetical protein